MLSRHRGLETLSNPKVVMTPLSGGRSAASVFKVNSRSRDSEPDSSFVDKIAPLELAIKEQARYEAYARNDIPEDMRPELLAFVQNGDIGAMCYQYVGSNAGSPLETLTAKLNREQVSAVDIVMREVFERLKHSWYAPHRLA